MKKLQLFKTMLLLCALIVGGVHSAWADDVLYSENFGNPASNTNISSYSGWSATSSMFNLTGAETVASCYSGNKVGSGNASTTSDYSVASGQGNAYQQGTASTTTTILTVQKIKITGKSSLSLNFAIYNGGAAKYVDAYYQIDSGSETKLTLTGYAASTGWQYVSASIPGTGTNLKLIFKQTPTKAWTTRIDDIKLTGVAAAPEAPTFDPVAGGEFNAAFDLTISSATGTTLKYTTDGTDPASSGTATSVATNSAVVSIPAATTRVRAIAIKDGINSDETDVTYTYSSKEEPTFTLSPSPLNLKVGANGTLTLTTNSDGDVTFSCDDAHVSLSGTGNSRTVSADAAGSYTIDVSIDASATYMSKAGSVTLNVTKYDTSVAIDASGIAVTNLKNGTAAGTVTASVTYGEPASAVPESSVTWSSSKATVATVNATTGVITLVGVGNATITATYAGNDTYNGSNSTYVLTVTDSRTSFEWNLSTNSYDATPSTSLISWSHTEATMKNEQTGSETAVNNYIPTTQSSTRMYKDNRLTITPSSNYRITSVEFTATTEGYATALKNSSWTNASATSSAKVATVTPTDGSSAFYATIGGTCGFTKVKVFYEELATITLASACTNGTKYFATYSNSKAFVVPEGLTVSCVGIDKGVLDVMSYSTGDVVKAGIGVLVSATSAGDKTIYLTNETGTELSGNLLKPSGDAGISASNMNVASTSFYRLTMHNGTQIGFWYGAADGAAFDLGANKAYLAVPDGSGARVLGYTFDDETTGVNEVKEVKEVKDNSWFDLQGRRVAQPTKGLYIVNGKKVVIK